MAIVFTCPVCGKRLRAGDELADKLVACTRCGARQRVPPTVEKPTPGPPRAPSDPRGLVQPPTPPALPESPPALSGQPPPLPKTSFESAFTSWHLPGCAKAICVLCVVVIPGGWLVDLAESIHSLERYESLPGRGVLFGTIFVCLSISLAIAIAGVIAGLALAQLKAWGFKLVVIVLWAHLGQFVLAVVMGAFVAGFLAGKPPDFAGRFIELGERPDFAGRFVESTASGIALQLVDTAISLASLAGDVLGLIWLYRRGAELPLVDN